MRNSKGQFVKGSSGFTGKHTDETKRKISFILKSKKLIRSDEYRKKMSLIKKGHPTSENTKLKISHALIGNKNNFGKKLSPETIKKITDSQKGKKLSDDHKRKLSLAKIGKPSKRKGCKVSEETKEKLRQYVGEKASGWKGGLSKIAYSVNWTLTLKRSIRERDKYTCQICGSPQEDRVHAIHHIDYDKKNCNPNNLITLCIKCHCKTNNNRNYWIEYFKSLK